MFTSLKRTKTIEILYVEDNPGDVLLMKEILKISKFPIHLSVARNGEKALEMLQESQSFSGKGKPDIILLDLSLPGINGLEVLAEIKKNKELNEIPVLIFGQSQNDQDIRSAYQNHANFYIVKPMSMEHFSAIMTYIEKFWLSPIR